MRRALILGGTGLIGTAVARRLLAAGWQVDLTGRDGAHVPASLTQAGARFIAADRSDTAAVRAAAGDGADLIADCLCHTAADAAGLLPLARATSSTVMISSSAVYIDAAPGRSPGSLVTSGKKYCSTTQPTWPTQPTSRAQPTRRSGVIRGTRGSRSCST